MALTGVTGPGVMENSTTTGTGTYTLAGAVTGYQTVGAVLANGDTGYFSAIGVDANGNRNSDGWEEFYGTYTSAGTTLARTKIEKSSNSNNAVNWGAGTRRISLLDLPSKSKGLNAVIHGVTLPNAKFVNAQGVNLATGDRDLYTVPAGKRALVLTILAAYNNSAGTIAAYVQAKVSGTYRRISSVSSMATATGPTGMIGGAIILEAGEILSVNVATTSGLNVFPQIIEFDAVCPFFTAKAFPAASGNQTLYTCPTGKTATIVGLVSNVIGINTTGVVHGVGDGTGQSIITHLVPSGQAVGNNYKMMAAFSIAANTRSSQTCPGCLGAGDFINLNVSAGAPNAWVNILEVGN